MDPEIYDTFECSVNNCNGRHYSYVQDLVTSFKNNLYFPRLYRERLCNGVELCLRSINFSLCPFREVHHLVPGVLRYVRVVNNRQGCVG